LWDKKIELPLESNQKNKLIMKKAIESLNQTIENIDNEIQVTIDKSIYDDNIDWTEMDYKLDMLNRAKTEAIKCLTTLRYINQ